MKLKMTNVARFSARLVWVIRAFFSARVRTRQFTRGIDGVWINGNFGRSSAAGPNSKRVTDSGRLNKAQAR